MDLRVWYERNVPGDNRSYEQGGHITISIYLPMASTVPGYQYGIIISYRQMDNLQASGGSSWVMEFVNELDKEDVRLFEEETSGIRQSVNFVYSEAKVNQHLSIDILIYKKTITLTLSVMNLSSKSFSKGKRRTTMP